jgi:hypothetical protein
MNLLMENGNMKGGETMKKMMQFLSVVVLVVAWGVLSILSIKEQPMNLLMEI